MQLSSAPPLEPHAFNVGFCFRCRGCRLMRAYRATFNIKYRGAGRFGAKRFRRHIVVLDTYRWCKVFPPPVKIGPSIFVFFNETIQLIKTCKWVGAWGEGGGLRWTFFFWLWCMYHSFGCIKPACLLFRHVYSCHQGFTKDIQKTYRRHTEDMQKTYGKRLLILRIRVCVKRIEILRILHSLRNHGSVKNMQGFSYVFCVSAVCLLYVFCMSSVYLL